MSYIDNKRKPHIDIIKEWCGDKLEFYMNEFNYDEPTKLVLLGKEEEFRKKYPEYIDQYYEKELLKNKLAKEYISNPFRIMRDVAMGWFTEDYTIMQLRRINGLKIERNGTEGRNLLVDTKNIDNKPDFYVEYKGQSFYIEFITDYTNEWKETGKVWLRNKKGKKLRSRNIFILGRCLLTDEFIITPSFVELFYETRYYGKPGYFYTVDPDIFTQFNIPNMVDGFNWMVNYIKKS